MKKEIVAIMAGLAMVVALGTHDVDTSDRGSRGIIESAAQSYILDMGVDSVKNLSGLRWISVLTSEQTTADGRTVGPWLTICPTDARNYGFVVSGNTFHIVYIVPEGGKQ